MKYLIILSSLLWAATVVAQGDQCDLDCHRSAPCENSDADFSDHVKYDDGAALAFHTKSNINGMHCSCPHGWTGLTCNRAYNTCDKDHKCYNGGTVSFAAVAANGGALHDSQLTRGTNFFASFYNTPNNDNNNNNSASPDFSTITAMSNSFATARKLLTRMATRMLENSVNT